MWQCLRISRIGKAGQSWRLVFSESEHVITPRQQSQSLSTSSVSSGFLPHGASQWMSFGDIQKHICFGIIRTMWGFITGVTHKVKKPTSMLCALLLSLYVSAGNWEGLIRNPIGLPRIYTKPFPPYSASFHGFTIQIIILTSIVFISIKCQKIKYLFSRPARN